MAVYLWTPLRAVLGFAAPMHLASRLWLPLRYPRARSEQWVAATLRYTATPMHRDAGTPQVATSRPTCARIRKGSQLLSRYTAPPCTEMQMTHEASNDPRVEEGVAKTDVMTHVALSDPTVSEDLAVGTVVAPG